VLVIALAAVAALAAGCGAGSSSATPSDAMPTNVPSASSAGGACASAPAPSDMSAWGPPATSPTLIPVMVSNYVGCGRARILFLYLDGANNVKSAPDRSATVAFYDLGLDPNTVAATAQGEFVWTIQDDRGMYILNVDLPQAGTWGAEFTTEAPGSAPETVRLTFEVHDDSPTVALGDAAPASDTPTLADVGGDVARISTDKEPNPDFYSTSVADALTAQEPFVLVFATPKFCASAQCGPTLDRVKAMAADHPEVTFINVEPYKLHEVDGQLEPLLDATGNLQAAEPTNAWGLLAEPWIFAVDRGGIVRGSFELTVTDTELEAVIAEITAGG
jgi:hypothetical protein